MDQALRYSSATIGTITAFGQIVAIGASMLLPSLLKKRNAGWMLITATVGLGISLLLLALSSHWVVVTLGRLGVLVTMAMWLPTLQVYQMEIVEESSRGIVYGAMSMAMGLGFATMSYTGGFVIESYGYGAIFIVGACISAVAAIIMMGIQNKHQKTLPTKKTATY
jgi:predicted MFS family arabinose efflux permease